MSSNSQVDGCYLQLVGVSANVLLTVSPLSILKNPMILIAGISMVVVFGMPYLMDNSKYNLSSLDLPTSNIRTRVVIKDCTNTLTFQWTQK